MYLINGTIHTMDDATYAPGYIAFEDGVITAVGPMDAYAAPEDGEALDVSGCHVYPGLIDAHSHLGLFLEGTGEEDANETSSPITPQLRVADGINPFDRTFSDALNAGITTVVVAPGSTNPIGGQIAAIKTAGTVADHMVLCAPLAIKFALGENPKNCYGGNRQAPVTRMATASMIRQTLLRARDYMQNKDTASSDYDEAYEALLPLLRGEISAHFHVHRADDIATAIRIAKEFSLRCVLIHCTEGHKIAPYLASEGVFAVTGPIINNRCKAELDGMCAENTRILLQEGILTAICTDHPENPQQHLLAAAALCAGTGIDTETAMACITCNAAKIAGLENRVGTLGIGKDADIAVFSAHPLDIAHCPGASMVFINGQRVK